MGMDCYTIPTVPPTVLQTLILPYYTQPKLHAAEAIYEKIVHILFPKTLTMLPAEMSTRLMFPAATSKCLCGCAHDAQIDCHAPSSLRTS